MRPATSPPRCSSSSGERPTGVASITAFELVQGILIRRRGADAPGDELLDRLEVMLDVRGEPVEGGRSYDLTGSKDWVVAIASMRGQLDEISPTWEEHLEFESPALEK